jgi:hypothetical protein
MARAGVVIPRALSGSAGRAAGDRRQAFGSYCVSAEALRFLAGPTVRRLALATISSAAVAAA